jgi:hypothetical protein
MSNYQFWDETGTELMTLCQDHTKRYIFDLTGDDKLDSISGTQTVNLCMFCEEQLNSLDYKV